MHLLFRDIETRSTLDLKKVGSWLYAGDASTEVLCVAYAVDDEPARIWVPGDPIPEEFFTAARDPDWLIIAHNDQFERNIEERLLGPRFGWPLVPIERHRCTMAMALASALPGSLDGAAAALGLPAKDTEGHRLMMQMAKPRKARKGEDPDVIHWHDGPEQHARLQQYCATDMEVERAIYRKLPALSPAEQKLWELDARINQRGFFTDGPLLEAASRIADTAGEAVQSELAQLTGGALTSTDQRDKLQTWLAEHGCEVKDVQKKTLKSALRRKELDPVARRVIELRLGAAHAAATKIDALLAWRDTDGRVRGTLRFHRASTGRWAGFGPQPQNMKRDGDGMDAKRQAVATGDLTHVAGLYPQPLEVVGDIARSMICGAPGHRLLIGDFSGIESRVLAWISQQQSKLDLWAKYDATGSKDDDPYVVIGRSLGHPEDTARAYGKIADLAFGFQGGVGAWQNFAPEDDASDETTIKRYRDSWRASHPRTEHFWHTVDHAAITAVQRPDAEFRFRNLAFNCDDGFLRITLPSGKLLSYPSPRIETNRFGHACVVYRDNSSGKWVDCNFGKGAYGGLWTENIISGIARDLLVAAMIQLEDAGYRIILHVHDEIIAEVPVGFGSIEEFQYLLTRVPAWAAGLPIAAKAREGERFSKPDAPAKAPAEQLEDLSIPDDLSIPAFMNRTGAPIPPAEVRVKRERRFTGLELAVIPVLDAPLFGIVPDLPGEESERPRSNGHDREKRNDDGYPFGGERKGRRIVESYVYLDAAGRPYHRVSRTDPKGFPQETWTGTSWKTGIPEDFVHIPYRLPELIRAPNNQWTLIAEGESCADAVASLDLIATTNSGGAGKWWPELGQWFVGKQNMAVLEDNDASGRDHASKVAAALHRVAPKADIRIVTFRELPERGDVKNWIGLGHTKAELLARVEAAPVFALPLPFLDMSRWDDEEPPLRRWAVPDRIPALQTSLLSGEGAVGKSIVQLQLTFAHVVGGEWLLARPERGPALYIDAEDEPDELWRRAARIAAHYGVSFAEATRAGLHLMSLAGHDAVLATASRNGKIEPTTLYDQLLEAAGDIRPKMIGIASSANVFAGAENDRSQVQQFISLLTRLAITAGGAVQLISHPSFTGISSDTGISGTTAWHNSVRARAYLKSVKVDAGEQVNSDLREIVFKKSNYGPIGDFIVLRYTNGLYLPELGVSSLNRAERQEVAREVFLALLKRFTAANRNVSANVGPGYAPAVFAREDEAKQAGVNKQNLEAAMRQLFQEGVIWNEPYGRPSRPYYRNRSQIRGACI